MPTPKRNSWQYPQKAWNRRTAFSLAKGSGFHLAAGVEGAYNFVHQGTQAAIPSGTKLQIILGDDYFGGACTLS